MEFQNSVSVKTGKFCKEFKIHQNGHKFRFTLSNETKSINLTVFNEEFAYLWKVSLTMKDLFEEYKMIQVFSEISEVYSYVLESLGKAEKEDFSLLKFSMIKEKLTLQFFIIINEKLSKQLFTLNLFVKLPNENDFPKIIANLLAENHMLKSDITSLNQRVKDIESILQNIQKVEIKKEDV